MATEPNLNTPQDSTEVTIGPGGVQETSNEPEAKTDKSKEPVDDLASARKAKLKLREKNEQHRQAQAQQAEMLRTQQELTSLKAQYAEAQKAVQEYQHISRLVQDDPFEAMAKLGFSVDGLSKANTPEWQIQKFQAQFQRELQAERAKREALEQQILGEKKNQAFEQRVAAAKQAIQEGLETGNYPTVASWPARIIHKEVNDLLMDHHKQTGEWLDFEDALSFLEEDVAKQTEPATGNSQKPQKTNAGRAPEDGKKAPQSRTLRNQQATSSNSLPANLENLTPEQRLARLTESIGERFRARRT